MRIGDTVVARRTEADVVDMVRRRLTRSRRTQLAVGSVNLDHLHHFRGSKFRFDGGPDWLWLADGAPVAWRGSRLSGAQWPRVTGADLLEPLLDVAAEADAQVGFLGGMEPVHERLAAVLSARYPDAAPTRFWSPERADIESVAASAVLAENVRAAGVRMLVVGLGKPRQERWVAAHGAATGADVILAFGAAGDFLAGVVDRAPVGYRHHGLEWLYRLRQEPRRLARRYLVQGPAALLQLRHAVLNTADVTSLSVVPQGRRP